MYECSSCSNTYAWPQSLQRHIKNKHKDDETDDEKDITSPKSSDNSDKEHMDESGDDSTESEDDSTESEDDSTESEDDSTESESDDTSRKTTEDVWDDMILEVYNTEDYAIKVSKYENDYQNAEEYAKRDMLEVHTSDLKFNYYKLLLTYHRMQASKMHKKIMVDVKRLHKRHSYRKALRIAIHYRNSMFRSLLEDDISDEETDDERTYFKEFSD